MPQPRHATTKARRDSKSATTCSRRLRLTVDYYGSLPVLVPTSDYLATAAATHCSGCGSNGCDDCANWAAAAARWQHQRARRRRRFARAARAVVLMVDYRPVGPGRTRLERQAVSSWLCVCSNVHAHVADQVHACPGARSSPRPDAKSRVDAYHVAFPAEKAGSRQSSTTLPGVASFALCMNSTNASVAACSAENMTRFMLSRKSSQRLQGLEHFKAVASVITCAVERKFDTLAPLASKHLRDHRESRVRMP